MAWHGNKRVGHFNVMDSMHRIESLLHMNSRENRTEAERVRRGRYGLGDRRTLEQFLEFSGVDPMKRKTTQDK
jgi:hypothetical protein